MSYCACPTVILKNRENSVSSDLVISTRSKTTLSNTTKMLRFKNGIGQSSYIVSNMNSEKDKLLNRINEFLLLENNWNGYGASKFNTTVINKVRNIIYSLHRIPEVYPTGRDSIQVQFEKNNGDYLEFEVFENEIICLRIIGENENEFTLKTNNEIQENILNFYAKG